MRNYMKESDAFHQDPEGMADIRCRTRSCWQVLDRYAHGKPALPPEMPLGS